MNLLWILIHITVLLSVSVRYVTVATDSTASTFESAVKAAAGVYLQGPPPTFPESLRDTLQRTVLITVSNFGYLNHLMNFKCFTDRLGLKFLVFTMDSRISGMIDKRVNHLNSSMIGHPWMHGQKINEQSSKFRSKDFNIISNRKFEAALEVLKQGYHVIFSDPDVAIIKDPIIDLLKYEVDYVHSVNIACPL
jgi:hypothetical protein